MALSMSNTNSTRPIDQGILPMDTHICGVCRCEFDDIYIFIDHKKLCQVTVSGLPSRPEKEYAAASSKAYGGPLGEPNSNIDSQDTPHSHLQDNVLSKSQTESSLHYGWQTEEYTNVSESAITLAEPSQISNNGIVSLSNNSCQPQTTSSHGSGNGLQLLWHHLNSSDSFGDQTRLGSEYDVSNSVPVLNFSNHEGKLSSISDQSILSHELSSLRNKEVLPSIDLYRHVREQTGSDLLGSVETKSLNTIDTSTPCPEDLEVGQISAAMLGKLSKKFSSKFCFNETFSSLDKNSVEDESTSMLCDPVSHTSANGITKENSNYLSVHSKLDKSFITYRNLNAASAPVSEKKNANLKERRERLPGVSDELLTSSPPLTGKQSLYLKEITANSGKPYSQSSDDSTLSSSRISLQSRSTSVSPPSLTTFKAIFTSPSSGGHRLAPDVHVLKNEIGPSDCGSLSKKLSSKKEDEKQVMTDDRSVVERDTNTTSYKDISKLIQTSRNQVVLSERADSVCLETEDASSQNENVIFDQTSVNNFSNVADIKIIKSNVTENMGIKNNMVSVEFVTSSETTANAKEVSDISQATVSNSCLPLSSSNEWNTDGNGHESIITSSSYHSLPNEMILKGDMLMLAHQPGEVKEKATVMVIKDSENNLIMMYPGEEQGEIFISDDHTTTTIRGATTSCDSDKTAQDAHLLFQTGVQQEVIQTQELLFSPGTQLQQQQQSAEYHYLEKIEHPSNTTGFSEGTEYFRLTSSKGEDQTCNKAPIQIIAVENGIFSNALISNPERFQCSKASEEKKLEKLGSLDSKEKALQSSYCDVKRGASANNDDGCTILITKHNKSLKRGKESSLKMKSFLSSPKVKRDDMTSSLHVDARGTAARKVVSEASNASENYSHTKPGGNTETVKGSKGSERSFKCKFGSCSYRTNFYKDFQRHYRTHTGEKPFKCSICGRTFNRSDKLKTHMRWHYGQKPFQCKLCDYAAIESGSLKKHMRIHTDERPFQCQICPYASRNSSQLIVHLRTHTGDSPFHCNVCSAQFKINSDLKRHMRVHTGEKPFKCDKCDYRSSNKGNLKAHNKINHSRENEKKCPQCPFASSSLKRLREHIKTHDAARVIKCSVCPYTCNNATALRSHMMVHNSDRPFSCSVCHYSCKQSGNLKKHMQNVHGHGDGRVKIFMEPSSSRKALTPISSVKHVKVMESKATGQRRKQSANCRKMYMCNKCDCGFVRQDSLRCHLKHHRQRIEKDGDKRPEKRLVSRTEGNSSSSQRQATKPPPSFAKHQGLDHIVAAASQLYQEQYMRNNRDGTQTTQSREDNLSNLTSQNSSGIVYHYGKKATNQQTNSGAEFTETDKTQQDTSHCQNLHAQHLNAYTQSQSEQSNIQHGAIPWEHSCYTLSNSKSRKHQSTTSNSGHPTSQSLPKPSSVVPLVPPKNDTHNESSNLSSQTAQQGVMDQVNGSTHSGSALIGRANNINADTIVSSQSGTILMRDAKPLLNTGSRTEPVTIIPSQPQSSDIHLVVQQHQIITPSPQSIPLSSFGNSQQPAVVMAHESMEIGSSDSQAVTFQVLPQVATLNQGGSQVATFTQDLTGQLSLQATPSIPQTHGTPIQISFPSGTQLIPQGSTLITQPQIMFQLAGGTSQLNQNGQEVISIAPDQPSGVTNSSLVNQAPQLVLGNIPSYECFQVSSSTC